MPEQEDIKVEAYGTVTPPAHHDIDDGRTVDDDQEQE